MKFGDLSDQQQSVVTVSGSTTLVLGGAGTGKTTAALWVARTAIEQGDVGPHQRVLFLTFSRTAVSQIASRSLGVLDAIRERVEVSTFHAFGLRMLQDFGRYTGLGAGIPRVQSVARERLLGRDPASTTYDELVPAAIRILGAPRVGPLIERRWPLVICDEFQDTSPEQWELLRQLSRHARMVLLADPNQMIYTFVPGVSPERLQTARAHADVVTTLQPSSFRDPSGCIPVMAGAIRERRFSSQEVRHAVAEGRLTVHAGVTDEAVVAVIRAELQVARETALRSVGIFAHSNEGVAQLGASLADDGIEHALVGIPEAQGEALATLAALCGYGAGLVDEEGVGQALGTFLTACTRGAPPGLAKGMAFGSPLLPSGLLVRLQTLKEALLQASQENLDRLVATACGAWDQLGIIGGSRPWRLAAIRFAASARRLTQRDRPLQESVLQLIQQAERDRASVLVGNDFVDHHPVQIMNFHQTKGREVDQVILLYRSGDYLADRRATEPFADASRVLYVALTRARQRVVVMLPSDPHPLIAPFGQLLDPPHWSS